jgi:hypothetical protein
MVPLLAAALAMAGILQIRIIEGNGAVHAPSSRSARPLVVEITDDAGRPVRNATVTFQMPDEGPSGTFSSGLRTDVATTDAHGRAAVRSMRFNRVTGPFEIRILAVKDQVRAGIVSPQFISQGAKAVARRPKARWVFLGAAALGTALGILVGGRGESVGGTASGEATVSVGTPTIGISRP